MTSDQPEPAAMTLDGLDQVARLARQLDFVLEVDKLKSSDAVARGLLDADPAGGAEPTS